ncbi:FAD-dependent oxidoreductase, partial [Streptacidiphilus pinicola]
APAPLTDAAGRVVGVTAVGEDGESAEYRADVVIAADGAPARTALATGWRRDDRTPIATAARRYYRTDAFADDEFLHLWADLRFAGADAALPGYGWLFPLADGRVNLGLGGIPHRKHGAIDLRASFGEWIKRLPEGWKLDEAAAESPLRSAALPMGLNRRPQYRDGMLVVGDSAGMVSPWSGEGIGEAMEAGEIAAESVALALTRPSGARREQALHHYPKEVHRRWSRHYLLGNVVAGHVFARFGYRPLLNRAVTSSPAATRLLAGLFGHLRG